MPRLLAVAFGVLAALPALAQPPIRPVSYAPEPAADLTLTRPALPKITLPVPAAPATAPARADNRLHFSPQAVEVKHDGKRWQLWTGRTLLKDFGDHREQAYEARRLIADLQLSEHAIIGTPSLGMEYWLSNGAAPSPPTTPRQIIPFEPAALTADRLDGKYCLRDNRQVLFQFASAEDAATALAVCRQYHFNEIGLIGAPTPSLVYLVDNPHPHSPMGSPDNVLKPRLLPTQAAQHALILPKLGSVGERKAFDPMRADLYRAADGWHLMAGPHDLGGVGTSDYLARVALRTVQQYPLTEYAQAGGVGFYLSRGQAPRGVPIGVRSTHFDPKMLAVKAQGDQLLLTDGKQTVASFAPAQAADAKVALQVLQYYGFDSQCEAGGLHYLARER